MPLDEDDTLTDSKRPTSSLAVSLDDQDVSNNVPLASPISPLIAQDSKPSSGSRCTPKVAVALASPDPTPLPLLQVRDDREIPPALPTVHGLVHDPERSVADGAASGSESLSNAGDISGGNLVFNVDETSNDLSPGLGTSAATPLVIEVENVAPAGGIPGPSSTVTASLPAQNDNTTPEGDIAPIKFLELPAVLTPVIPDLNPFQKAMLGGGILVRLNVNTSSRFRVQNIAALSSSSTDAFGALPSSTPAGASSSNIPHPGSAVAVPSSSTISNFPVASSVSTSSPAWTPRTNPFSGVTTVTPIFDLGTYFSLQCMTWSLVLRRVLYATATIS